VLFDLNIGAACARLNVVTTDGAISENLSISGGPVSGCRGLP